jgi:glycosyltransferase involved in cell wall biosynthesis
VVKQAGEKPRVCILIGAFFPVVGGGETHALLLSRELVRMGGQVTVVTRRTSSSLKKMEMIEGVPVHRVNAPASPRFGKYAMLFPALFRLIALRNEYDVIYVCALRVLGVVGIVAALLLGKKCVLRSESCGELSGDFIWQSFHSESAPKQNILIRAVLAMRNRFYRRADAFLSISSLIEKEFKACGVPADKLCSISCGLDTERFSPVNPEQKKVRRATLSLPDAFVFAYSGKLNLGKGLDVLLRAWKRIAQEKGNIHLVLIGGGAEHFMSCERELRDFVDHWGLGERVTFTGYVANVEHYLQAIDAFVFPSLKESFGLAPLEAMACGVPVISTRVGELPHVIEDGKSGLLVDAGNEDELYRAMVQIADDPAASTRMAKVGRETVVARLGIRQVAEQHEGLFSKLCEEGGA